MSGLRVTNGGQRTCGNVPSPRCWTNGEWDSDGNSYNALKLKCSYYCKHKRYNGDPNQCCIGKGSTVPQQSNTVKTCDPKIFNNPVNSACSNVYNNYCKQSDYIFSDSRCKAFCQTSANQALCKQQQLAYCANILSTGKIDTDPYCSTFCSENDCGQAIVNYCSGDNLKGQFCTNQCFRKTGIVYDCTQNLLGYCSNAANAELPQCQCFLPTAQYQEYYSDLLAKLPVNAQTELKAVLNKQPYCSYTPCASSQYLPKSPTQCPNVNVCINNATIDSNGNLSFGGDVNIKQDCPNWQCNDANPCTNGLSCVNGVCSEAIQPQYSPQNGTNPPNGQSPPSNGQENGQTPSNGSNGTNPPTTDQPTDQPQSSNRGKTIVLIIGFTLIFILIIIAIWLLL